MLDEIGVHGTQRDTYKFVNKLKEKVIEDNITLPCKFEVRGSKWFWNTAHNVLAPKDAQEYNCSRFIVASRECSKMALSK